MQKYPPTLKFQKYRFIIKIKNTCLVFSFDVNKFREIMKKIILYFQKIFNNFCIVLYNYFKNNGLTCHYACRLIRKIKYCRLICRYNKFLPPLFYELFYHKSGSRKNRNALF